VTATPSIGKGQKWPVNRFRDIRIDTFLAGLRDQQEVKVTCGIDGCQRTYEGRFAQVRGRLERHRGEKHPDWKPPRRRRRK
jgi:hypothetical protein